jgi:ubiquinone/menaquinone biosynthesis C-methylase UbiE
MPDPADRLVRHYAPGATTGAGAALLDRLLGALAAAGLDLAALTALDLAPLDQFHSRGRPATLDLARRAGISPGQQVLDLGGGLGGAARILAAEFGATVVVCDLTPAYCHAGQAFTRLVGLSGRVSFRVGNATSLPDPAAAYDVFWTQHSTMNIPDKAGLYAEAWRVLRPGGRLALHEIVAGPGGAPVFPMPWATHPADSHLLPQAELRSLILRSSFRELIWEDESALALSAFQSLQQSLQARGDRPFPVGLHLLVGAGFPAMIANLTRGLAEQRLAVVQAVFQRG